MRSLAHFFRWGKKNNLITSQRKLGALDALLLWGLLLCCGENTGSEPRHLDMCRADTVIMSSGFPESMQHAAATAAILKCGHTST